MILKILFLSFHVVRTYVLLFLSIILGSILVILILLWLFLHRLEHPSRFQEVLGSILTLNKLGLILLLQPMQ